MYLFHPLKSRTEIYHQKYEMQYPQEMQNKEITTLQNTIRRKSGKRMPTKGSRRLTSTYEEKPQNHHYLESDSKMPVFPNFPQIPRTKKPQKPKFEKKLKSSTQHIHRSQEYPHKLISNIADLVSESWNNK